MLRAQAVNQDSLVVLDFQNRVDDYMKLRKQAVSDTPTLKPTESAEEIVQHRRQLAEKISAARPNAQQGALFTPQVSDLFRRLLATSFKGPKAAKIRASLRRAAPVPQQPLQVDGRYPKDFPLQSTPPSLLLGLPRLPKELEYRIVGSDLVLLDVNAQLIVDYLPRAIPPP